MVTINIRSIYWKKFKRQLALRLLINSWKYSQCPITGALQGNKKKFELLRVQSNNRKWGSTCKEMGWGSNGSTMQSLLQAKQEIQWYLKKEVWSLYRAGHCIRSRLKKGIKDKEYMYIVGMDVFK